MRHVSSTKPSAAAPAVGRARRVARCTESPPGDAETPAGADRRPPCSHDFGAAASGGARGTSFERPARSSPGAVGLRQRDDAVVAALEDGAGVDALLLLALESRRAVGQ